MLEMNISENQLYNAEESGIYFRMLPTPTRTYVKATEKSAPGRKIPKERLTFVLTANADGSHKVKPLLIGKSKNPRCFKGFDNPLPYANSKAAWMTRNIFRDWFFNHVVNEEVCFIFKFVLNFCLFYISYFIYECHSVLFDR